MTAQTLPEEIILIPNHFEWLLSSEIIFSLKLFTKKVGG